MPSVPIKIADATGALDHEPRPLRNPTVVGRLHLHEDITGVQLAFVDRLLAAADPLDLLGGHLNPADNVGQALLLDLPLQGFPDLHFLIRRNSQNVPMHCFVFIIR